MFLALVNRVLCPAISRRLFYSPDGVTCDGPLTGKFRPKAKVRQSARHLAIDLTRSPW